MDNNNKLGTLTAKMDALRAKGFSDDEINQILSGGASSPAVKTVEEKEHIEQWNNRVDSVHKYEWIGSLSVIAVIAVIGLSAHHFDLSYKEVSSLILVIGICVAIAAYYQTSRIKEFFKKRS